MQTFGLSILYALFVWWFSTGLILLLARQPKERHIAVAILGTLAGVGAAMALAIWHDDTSVAGAGLAFTAGVVAWGWVELLFYIGILAGPRRLPCPEGTSPLRRFGLAILATLTHEIASLACLAAVALLSAGAPNRIAVSAYAVLWLMQISARLNVFLGVANLNEDFLPSHVAYLRSYMRQGPMNLLFPLSVMGPTVAAVILAMFAGAPDAGPGMASGYTMLATLLALAAIEHWFMVLPIPVAALWRWSLRDETVAAPAENLHRSDPHQFGLIGPGVVVEPSLPSSVPPSIARSTL